jgi:hypothetical protein
MKIMHRNSSPNGIIINLYFIVSLAIYSQQQLKERYHTFFPEFLVLKRPSYMRRRRREITIWKQSFKKPFCGNFGKKKLYSAC